jgi:hypothetical protein
VSVKRLLVGIDVGVGVDVDAIDAARAGRGGRISQRVLGVEEEG